MDNKYNNFKYDECIEDILSRTILNEKDMAQIEDMKNRTISKTYNPIVSDLYKLTKIHKLTTTQISQIYDTGLRNIQIWLKELGLNRSIKKAKKIKKEQYNLEGLDSLRKYYNTNNVIYKDFEYEEKFKKILSEIALTKEDTVFIEKATKTNSMKKYSFIIEDLYKFVVIMKIPNKEVSSIYGIEIRTLCTWLNELNFHRVEITEKRISTPTRKDDYIDFKYENKELNILKITSLTEEQEEILKNIYLVWGKSKYSPIIEDLYKFWINEYSSIEIGNVYGKSSRLFQIFFKKCGLNRDKYEAQAIAVKKRNYKEIQLKGRQTMIENNTSIDGSNQEQYARNLLNCKLALAFPDVEIIVGLNNKSILSDGREIDIPIIVINESNVIKIAVEYNGSFWHRDYLRDEDKATKITDKDYHIFYIEPKPQATKKQTREDIENTCQKIIEYIKLKLKNGFNI